MGCSVKNVEVIDSSSRYPLQQGYYNRSLNEIIENKTEKKERVVVSVTSKERSTFLSRAEKAMEYENYTEAVKIYKEMILYFPTDDEAFFNLGKIYIQLKLYKEGLAIFKKAIEDVDKINYIFYLNKGICEFNLRKYEEAIESFNKGLFLEQNDVDLYLNKGVAFNHLKKYDDAIECFKKGLLIKNNDGSLFNNIGVSYFRKKNYDKSIEFYDEAIRCSPRDPLPFNNKGVSLKLMQRYKEALDCFNKAIERCGQYQHAVC